MIQLLSVNPVFHYFFPPLPSPQNIPKFPHGTKMFSPALAYKTSEGVGVYTLSLLSNPFYLLIAVLQLDNIPYFLIIPVTN